MQSSGSKILMFKSKTKEQILRRGEAGLIMAIRGDDGGAGGQRTLLNKLVLKTRKLVQLAIAAFVSQLRFAF